MAEVLRGHRCVSYPTGETDRDARLGVPPLLAGALNADDAEALGRGLRVLPDPTRLRILSLIRSQPTHEACLCHLTAPLGLTQPTVSHHMKVLLDAGLVEREQRESWAYFRVREEPLAALRAFLG
jgi:ArsR family transcriptional regulator